MLLDEHAEATIAVSNATAGEVDHILVGDPLQVIISPSQEDFVVPRSSHSIAPLPEALGEIEHPAEIGTHMAALNLWDSLELEELATVLLEQGIHVNVFHRYLQ
jgi:hypothetical protein